MRATTLRVGGALFALAISASAHSLFAQHAPSEGQLSLAPPAAAIRAAEADDEPGWLGVYLEDRGEGEVFVDSLVEGGPAAKAGLRPGDRLAVVAGTAVESYGDVVRVLGHHASGDEVLVELYRGAELVVLRVALGARPNQEVAAPSPQPATPEVRELLGALGYVGAAEAGALPTNPSASASREAPSALNASMGADGGWLGVYLEDAENGARVVELIGDGPASAAGVQVGDIVTRIGGTRVASADDLIEALAKRSAGDVAKLRLTRDGETVRLDVSLVERPSEFTLPPTEPQDFLESPAPHPPAPPASMRAPLPAAFELAPAQRAFLGVYLDAREEGVFLGGVVDGGPAEAAGLQGGDELLSLGDRKIAGEGDVHEFLAQHASGEEIQVVARRDGQERKLALVLGSRPEEGEYFGAGDMPAEGLELEAPYEFQLEGHSGGGYMGISLGEDEDGVFIEEVLPGTPAERAGLRAGDRLLRLFSQQVSTSAEVIELVGAHSAGDEVSVRYRRDGQEARVEFELGQRVTDEFFGAPERAEFELHAAPGIGGEWRQHEPEAGEHEWESGEHEIDIRVERSPHLFTDESDSRYEMRYAPAPHDAAGDLERVLERIERMEERITERLNGLERRLDQLQGRAPGGASRGTEPRAIERIRLRGRSGEESDLSFPRIERIEERLREREGSAPHVFRILGDRFGANDDDDDDDDDGHDGHDDDDHGHDDDDHGHDDDPLSSMRSRNPVLLHLSDLLGESSGDAQGRISIRIVGPDGEVTERSLGLPPGRGALRVLAPDLELDGIHELYLEDLELPRSQGDGGDFRWLDLGDGESFYSFDVEHGEEPATPGVRRVRSVRARESAEVERSEAQALRARIEELEQSIRALRQELEQVGDPR